MQYNHKENIVILKYSLNWPFSVPPQYWTVLNLLITWTRGTWSAILDQQCYYDTGLDMSKTIGVGVSTWQAGEVKERSVLKVSLCNYLFAFYITEPNNSIYCSIVGLKTPKTPPQQGRPMLFCRPSWFWMKVENKSFINLFGPNQGWSGPDKKNQCPWTLKSRPVWTAPNLNQTWHTKVWTHLLIQGVFLYLYCFLHCRIM